MLLSGLIPPIILDSLINMDDADSVRIIGIQRHRLLCDGKGVTTLVGFQGCPLKCKYCLNPQSLCKNENDIKLSPSQLYERVKIDNLYFLATGGGICFGGGEPGLYPQFICQFREICGNKWKLTIETSLNYSLQNLKQLTNAVDNFIIDIKDIDNVIYKKYTGKDNFDVIRNLKFLASEIDVDRIIIRIPFIPDYNNLNNINSSITFLNAMGFKRIEKLKYLKDPQKTRSQKKSTDNTINYGKAKCEVLKEIRKTIATSNSIEFQPNFCPNTYCETGTCPSCESELAYLEEQLGKISQSGREIIF